MRLRLLPICMLIALAALPAEAALAQGNNRAPTANFSWNPPVPITGQNVTFTSSSSDPDGTIASYRWALDPDGAFNDGTTASVVRKFPGPGNYSVELEVTDNRGAKATVTKSVTVANRAPTACFTQTPAAPLSSEPVTLSSACSSDADGRVTGVSWDLNGDNAFGDSTERSVVRTFPRPGSYTIRLNVVDDRNAVGTVAKTITIRNRLPTATFSWSPASPTAGAPLRLSGSATDPDGTVGSYAWDLDGDGQFDDATGATTTFTPRAAGSYDVGLRAADDSGGAADSRQAITVGAAVPRPSTPRGPTSGFDNPGPVVPPPGPSLTPTLRFLDPFPVVRMRGRTNSRGVRLSLFSVRGPHGALAQVRCKGRGCPAKRLRKRIRTKSKRGARTVRFKRLERRLRAGTELRVTVTQKGMVGKFTRIRIRRMKLPVRVDRCVVPGTRKPAACPEGR